MYIFFDLIVTATMRPKKIKLHELPHTKLVKSGTITIDLPLVFQPDFHVRILVFLLCTFHFFYFVEKLLDKLLPVAEPDPDDLLLHAELVPDTLDLL